ncbi:MAG TPA: SDR family oxidoreductase [Solirubrobacterales bacterium]|nr:SDR family oxidoreductase [Solirubrobacterales bacterium]
MPAQLEDKIAVVTAGGSGIGRATSLLFAAEGAKVAVVDIDGEAADETARQIAAAAGECSAHAVDCADVGALERLFADIDRRYGRVDVLFNHAGTPNAHGVAEVEEREFDRAVDLNLRSGFFATRFALPLMTREGRGGAIIFTASTSGLMGSETSPLYSMTKHGVVGMVRSMAQLLAPEGIRVNAVCPGPVRTPMLAGFMNLGAEETDAVAEHYGSATALKRVAEPEEIAAAVLFLACDAASYVTGVPLPVDAGFVAK